jgi:glucose 1-dehydrogenase
MTGAAPTLDLRGDGKVALITGGAGGLGRSVAELFAAAGYRLLIADLDCEAGRELVGGLEARGAEARFVETDVSVSGQARRAVETAVETWGSVDFVLNNAGVVGRGGLIQDLDEADLERVLAVDLAGAFHVSKHAVRAQMRQGGGSILNVASITAWTGSAYYAAYSAAKAGLIALTRSLARNAGRFNVRINCLSPGSIAGTGLMAERRRGAGAEDLRREELALLRRIPLGRPARPLDVAYFALFLASPLAAHVHGAVLTIDGGESLGYH